ncbi:hypothetical protein RRF57_008130 [Xylaria bambusicola]|uniref:FHA domain-containing protein n=1 Tax=Xylaria bambusicola TaxID=326684 RepID=A0AAN7UTD1_9PEZI
MRAANAANGGIFVVSGRAAIFQAEFLEDKDMLREYLNEHIWVGTPEVKIRIRPLQFRIPKWKIINIGPIVSNNDNFLTRKIVKHRYKIRFQNTEGATMETDLGQNGTFVQQTQR